MKQKIIFWAVKITRIGAYANLAAWWLTHWIFYNPWPMAFMERHDGTKNPFALLALAFLNACDQLGFWMVLTILTAVFATAIALTPRLRRWVIERLFDGWHALTRRGRRTGQKSEELATQEQW